MLHCLIFSSWWYYTPILVAPSSNNNCSLIFGLLFSSFLTLRLLRVLFFLPNAIYHSDSNQSSAITRCNIKTKNVKKDSSSSTTDAASLVIPSCTGLHDDPYRFGGTDPVPCCDGLEKKLKDWDEDGTSRYQCELVTSECCTTGIGCDDKSDCCYQFGDPDYCGLAVGSDSDGCCHGNCHYPVGRQRCWPWVVPPPKESDCCTTGIGCTENDDCCYQFGDPFYCKLDTNKSGCCVGECTYPDGRQSCYPWFLPRTNKCIPATGDFSGTSVTTGTEPLVPGQLDGLKYPFETCYLYGLMYPCYTESWTDGLGNYYQCHPKNPNEGTAKGNPWSSFQPPSFNTTCGTPCKDLAPATKPCLAMFVYCTVDNDCCGDMECSLSIFPGHQCL